MAANQETESLSTRNDRFSVLIVGDQSADVEELEAVRSTAMKHGLNRVASLIQSQIEEHDRCLIEAVLDVIDADAGLGSALVQLAVDHRVLRCRAWVSEQQQDRLIRSLASIPGAARVELEVNLAA